MPVIACLALLAFAGASGYVRAQDRSLDPRQELGRLLYLDVALSEPAGLACASCHGRVAGTPASTSLTQRDVAGAAGPTAEYPDTVNHTELGNLGLSSADEAALVAFVNTLTDGYRPWGHIPPSLLCGCTDGVDHCRARLDV